MQTPPIRRLVLRILILAVTATGMPFSVVAQQKVITLPIKRLSADEVFGLIEKQTDYRFTVNKSSFDSNIKVNVTQAQMSVDEILDKLFAGTDMTYAVDGKYIVVPVRGTAKPDSKATYTPQAPTKGNILGIITNSQTRHGVENVEVSLIGTDKCTTSDASGRFQINNVEPGSYAAKLFIAQLDTVIYRDMIVRPGITTQHDINVPLRRGTTDATDIILIPAKGKKANIKRSGNITATHTYILVEPDGDMKLYNPKAAVKTNLLYLAGTTANVATELRIAPKWTLDIAAGVNPGKFNDNGSGIRHISVQPEFRFWFCNAFERHFIGVHGLYSRFDAADTNIPFAKDLTGKRYNGNTIGAGGAYGYFLPVAPRWGLEFSVGGGYLYVDYKDYETGTDNQYVRKKEHYFGLTKAAVSLVYMIR